MFHRRPSGHHQDGATLIAPLTWSPWPQRRPFSLATVGELITVALVAAGAVSYLSGPGGSTERAALQPVPLSVAATVITDPNGGVPPVVYPPTPGRRSNPSGTAGAGGLIPPVAASEALQSPGNGEAATAGGQTGTAGDGHSPGSVDAGGQQSGSAAYCTFSYTFSSQWNAGYVVDLTLTNLSGQPWNGWRGGFTVAPSPQFTNTWGARLRPSGDAVLVVPDDYQGYVPAGGVVRIGATAAARGYEARLYGFTVNGHPCQGAGPVRR